MDEETDTLVLSSGGTKGIAFVGALEYMEKYTKFRLNNINTFIGTSVGGLFCSMFYIGFSLADIKNIIFENDFGSIFSDKKLLNFFNTFGMLNTENIKNRIKAILKTKGIDEDLNLGDAYGIFKKKIYLISVDIVQEKTIYLSHESFPEMTLVDAILSSMSIPFIFPPVNYKEMCLVDGALLEPVCLRVDLFGSSTVILDIKNNKTSCVNNLPDYVSKLIHTVVNNNKKECVYKNHFYYKINVGENSILDMNIDKQKITKLITEGFECIKNSLKIKKE
jgi:predicted acylesterase/phospholipase RssA